MEADIESITPFVLANSKEEWLRWKESIPKELRPIVPSQIHALFEERHGIAPMGTIMLLPHLVVRNYRGIDGARTPAESEFVCAFEQYAWERIFPPNWKRHPRIASSFGAVGPKGPPGTPFRCPVLVVNEAMYTKWIRGFSCVTKCNQLCAIITEIYQARCKKLLAGEFVILEPYLKPRWNAEAPVFPWVFEGSSPQDLPFICEVRSRWIEPESWSKPQTPSDVRIESWARIKHAFDVNKGDKIEKLDNEYLLQESSPEEKPLSGQCEPFVFLTVDELKAKFPLWQDYHEKAKSMIEQLFTARYGTVTINGPNIWLEEKYTILHYGELKVENGFGDLMFMEDWKEMWRTNKIPKGWRIEQQHKAFKQTMEALPFRIVFEPQQNEWSFNLFDELKKPWPFPARYKGAYVKCISRAIDLAAKDTMNRMQLAWHDIFHAIPTKDLRFETDGKCVEWAPAAKQFAQIYNRNFELALALIPDLLNYPKQGWPGWEEEPRFRGQPEVHFEQDTKTGRMLGETFTVTPRQGEEATALNTLLAAVKELERERGFIHTQYDKLNKDWQKCYDAMAKVEQTQAEVNRLEFHARDNWVQSTYEKERIQLRQKDLEAEEKHLVETNKAKLAEHQREVDQAFMVKEQQYLLGIREYEVLKKEATMAIEENKKRSDKLKREIERMRKARKAVKDAPEPKAKEADECVICMDKDAAYACVPCGHLSLCGDCKNLDKCPICRTPVRSMLKIFTS